ncbi:50S ribosomal protein L25/general stress protein Ctc [Fodinicola feengrottensis]|uniref:50S ribosomal protein L25/general stress protein Ctc n=1 Tax=Fodinicola feengrottensis TaxID=435914 RepID=UPI0013D69D71|nr:50S ribosomal protein L25/general stress protein Ctc [Fodinicola feengrottensis]
MSEVLITAEPRTEFGKGGARRTRRAGKIPAVLYGHGTAPRHVALPAREFHHGHARRGGCEPLLTVEIDGTKELALPKAIQRDPIKGTFEHVDLLLVRSGEKVTVDIPISIVGDPFPGGMINQELDRLTVEAEATHLPDGVEVSVEGFEVGSTITAGQITLPTGTTLSIDPEAYVVGIVAAQETSTEPTAEATADAGSGDDA